MSKPERDGAYTPQAVPSARAEASEFEQLEFMIESFEDDLKNLTFSSNKASAQARRAEEEDSPGLARLWQGRADDLRADIKTKAQAVRDAKEQRRVLMKRARFVDPAEA